MDVSRRQLMTGAEKAETLRKALNEATGGTFTVRNVELDRAPLTAADHLNNEVGMTAEEREYYEKQHRQFVERCLEKWT